MSLLSSFSTCEISDALVKLGNLHGGHLSDIRMVSSLNPSSFSSPVRICGPAYTVRMVPVSDTSAPKLKEHFVDTAPAGCVIVIDVPHQANNAVWGGLMTAGAQARGAVGVVISGRCRDVAEHRTAGFPVFARGLSTVGQSPFTRPSAVNVDLLIEPPQAGGIEHPNLGMSCIFPPVHIQPQDWIVADEDGVVCVPRELEKRVIELATRGQESDTPCMEDIKNGMGIQAAFNKHRH